jgi:phospholipid-translocating ATPase
MEEHTVQAYVPYVSPERATFAPCIGMHAHGHEDKRTVTSPPPDQNTPEGRKYSSNFVSTTKYTRFTFLPLNLMLQFQRFANCYFLAIAIMASIQAISPVSGTTFWFPLAIVISFTAAKDGNEDYRRHLSDIEENNRITEMFNHQTKQFEKVPWKDIRVGSIVRVTTVEDGCSPMIPADLALLATSSEDGTCFIETANLDGETNLKLREAPEVLQKNLTHMLASDAGSSKPVDLVLDKLAQLSCKIMCSVPDAFLYDFNARMEWNNQDISLCGGTSGGQFVQRSTKMKNTKWCVGVAVYTGKETKIQQNMSDPPNKVSNIERRLNAFILLLFCFQGALCFTGAVGAGVWIGRPETKESWYLGFFSASNSTSNSITPFNVDSPATSGIISFFSYLILLSLLIPISLYVSVEFVKAFVAFQISSDREMYVEEDDMPSKARSAGLCEELGQVNYIFSDKTGTLTQNLMEFKKCSVAGMEYGRGYCEVERAIARRNGKVLPADPAPPKELDPGFKFIDERLLFGKWRDRTDADHIRMFFLNLAINHTVQVEYASPESRMPIYQAESPDEGAFVVAARNMGLFFSKRMMKDITVKVSTGPVGEGTDEVWKVLNTNSFDNNRKRTSVICKNPQGELILFVKGADTSVMPFVEYNKCPFFDETQNHIDKFSDQGLRTLVFAGRKLTEEEYNEWNGRFKEASLMSQGREAALRELASTLEEGHQGYGQKSALFDSSTSFAKILTLYGVTALEDKLQVKCMLFFIFVTLLCI